MFQRPLFFNKHTYIITINLAINLDQHVKTHVISEVKGTLVIILFSLLIL